MAHPRDGNRGNGWGLLDQYVLRGLKRRDVFVLLWFVLIIALIWQDNSQGKLADLPGVCWTMLKGLILSGYLLTLAAIILAVIVLSGWVRTAWLARDRWLTRWWWW